ncbi:MULTISPECIES: methionine synthase [Protofrankia]|uniref:Methionine synthase vitamin-B12 independent n=1 Tax=Candidatus Protofrankia datiscae TaxID=2716812 RepID=F8B530_9ACTN|nr:MULTISPECIES: methionine synthase [Protofrankia]AEH11052.1 Methionine synthase vitamin-B12 independent [Candidatus Protofrankia datiscae]
MPDITPAGGRPWEPGTATGVGSLPGIDPVEACRLVFDELPDLPHLPELPARGAGADMIGRSAGLLADTPVDLQPSGWRLVPRPGVDLRRTRDLLARDLDALSEVAAGYTGPLKVAVAGPWTLAATVELPRGHKALRDAGASRDIAEALVEGLAGHLADIALAVPGARLIVQVDEPSLPAVLAGEVRTPSGFGVLPAVEEGVVVDRLRTLLAATGVPTGVHCCASKPPVGLLRQAGAAFVGLDATLLTPADDDAIGEAVEAGVTLMAGVVPARDVELSELSDVCRTVEPVRSMWRRLGFAPEQLREVVVVTPTCGLAGATPGYARVALRRCREAGRALADGSV